MKELIEEIQKEWNKKYYYPALEDFYIGFEYLTQDQGGPIHNQIFEEGDEISDIKHDIEHGFVFCKYLDKKDFEDLGFIYNYKFNSDVGDTKEHSCNMFQCILKDAPFCNSSRDIDLKITYFDSNIYRFEMYERNYFEWYPIFEGVLKNKSELINQLKRCGIIK